jgi:two-component system LytT family response regulator
MNPPDKGAQLKVLVVDDEPLACEGLRLLLTADPAVGEVSQAKNGTEAVSLIRSEQPDIVLLDVQMPGMDGFAVIREVGAAFMPEVIFVTAHDHYALEAFQFNAIDYLLKPVARDRFEEALRRARVRLQAHGRETHRIISLLETIASPRKYLTRFAVRSEGRTYFVGIEDVDWIQAAENYVQVHAGTTRHLLHVPIQTVQSSLDPEQFVRIHRSLIVNVGHIKEVEAGSHGEHVLTMRNGVRLQSSRTYHQNIKRCLTNAF